MTSFRVLSKSKRFTYMSSSCPGAAVFEMRVKWYYLKKNWKVKCEELGSGELGTLNHCVGKLQYISQIITSK